ncbi:hypothetical protein MGYG_06104 [Nannizzia gypsea CBS 118893]|uniref:Uncharacterized protein n=1 Tax=Arthroderma gypseum (strain ATCC MYA-4604 / CBS 118893) TaxID=535722 RepID=E4V0H2_ARTGP|nr:hypothetical protein MGYG_06104 [Nannizzia gypsea CBS 118893]EFR03109.1 hypothetical protein MGYG_06104 [Nannizzia gypsea CBS 118893]
MYSNWLLLARITVSHNRRDIIYVVVVGSTKEADQRMGCRMRVEPSLERSEFLVMHGAPPESTRRRRDDITIKYLVLGYSVAVFDFHEAKAMSAGPQDIQVTEYQALETFTSFGTKGHTYGDTKEITVILLLFFLALMIEEGGDYVELHSSDEALLSQAF